jgi:uncharacterized protein YceH (UPF0502 family)
MEKETTTPEYYPLTLNALVNACNQKNQRDPVVQYDDETVRAALAGLRGKGYILETTGGGHRVPKYSQRFSERLNFGRREQALLCELMLRGPQTVGELRGRAERMYAFADLEEVELCLHRLTEWPSGPLAVLLPKAPGAREARCAHRLSGEVTISDLPAEAAPANTTASREDRLRALETQVQELRSALDDLRREFTQFRQSFE